jgi:hypothetical protein
VEVEVAQRLPLVPLCELLLDVRPQRSSVNHHLVVAKSKKKKTNNLQGNNPVFPLEPTHVHHLSSVMNPPCHYVCFIIFRGLSIFTRKKCLEEKLVTNLMLVEDNSNGTLASVRCISDYWIRFLRLLASSSSACFWTRACLFKSISWFYLGLGLKRLRLLPHCYERLLEGRKANWRVSILDSHV